ncbi:MAG: ABC transporter permease [Candidatus Tectomicrobia bacterium]|uniref:ABC transporter permease n=1 Tax=Tectimicrobiota bacterium TaxID=2528274 RepID=A0A933GMJ2_UNCTE|nr:ABC transporter permease [Candidatus Tectomicrobia bacterium]
MLLLKLLLKNAFRHKLRALLTILGVTIVILAFGLLRTILSAWYAGVEASSATRLVTRNAISLIFPLPVSYKDKIRQVPGVNLVSHGNWFGGIYIDEKHFFASFAIEPKSYFKLYPEYVLLPDQKEAFLRDRRGFVAGRKLAERFGWKLGDAVTLRGTIFTGQWDFVMRGIYSGRDKNTDETLFAFHWDYLNEGIRKMAPTLADHTGFFLIGVSNPGLAAEVSLAIDTLFKNSLAETLTETEKAFQMSFVSMTEAIVMAIRLVSYVVIIIIITVVANTMGMTVRERMGEYAVFRTLGFGNWHIGGFILGESFIITMIGTVVGIALTFPVAGVFSDTLSAYFPIFNIARETIYMDLAAALIISVIAAIFPTWRALRMRIADGLRRIG